MSEWKQEYEGFPLGFMCFVWETRRVSTCIYAAMVIVGLLLTAFSLLVM